MSRCRCLRSSAVRRSVCKTNWTLKGFFLFIVFFFGASCLHIMHFMQILPCFVWVPILLYCFFVLYYYFLSQKKYFFCVSVINTKTLPRFEKKVVGVVKRVSQNSISICVLKSFKLSLTKCLTQYFTHV